MDQLTKLKTIEARLQTMATKQKLGIPLLPSEESLAMDLYRMQTMNPRERIHQDENGLHFERTIEVDGIFDGVKARMDSEEHNTATGVAGSRYLGSIDEITATVWAKECGAKKFSKEWMAYAKKQRESGDYSKYFPQNTRKLIK